MLSVWYEDNTITAHASRDKNISQSLWFYPVTNL